MRGETPVTLHTRKDEASALARRPRRALDGVDDPPARRPGRGHAGKLRGARLRAGRGARATRSCASRRSGSTAPSSTAKRVGEDLLTPGWTCYDKRIAFQTYPVAGAAAAGREPDRDLARATAGTARRSCGGDEAIFNCWGDRIGAHRRDRLGRRGAARGPTRSWQSGLLPIRESGIYFGEIYDARLEGRPATAGVEVLAFDTGLLVPQECRPVRELAPFPRRESWTDREGRTIYDFGQNAAGYVALQGARARRARGCIVEHSEIVDRDRRDRQPQLPLGGGADRVRAEGRRARGLPAALHLPGLPLRPR